MSEEQKKSNYISPLIHGIHFSIFVGCALSIYMNNDYRTQILCVIIASAAGGVAWYNLHAALAKIASAASEGKKS